MEEVQLLKKKPSWYRRWWGILILVILLFCFVCSGYIAYKAYFIYQQMRAGTYLTNKNEFDMKLFTDSLSPSWGNDGAPITIVEFADFNCPRCLQAFEPINIIKAKYSDKIKFYWRNYPVVKENSVEFALAGVCAERQGKFWEYHDIMFVRQGTISIGDLEGIMKEIGVDVEKYKTCMNLSLTMSQIRKDYFASQDGLVRGTPTFFINGHKLEGAIPLANWEEIIATLIK
ncbi:MAG: hypothetical protein UT32_C0018G0043 [Parcubacteria group bacterium GW2011_GWC2_39_14]|nr:MAG: hypothetical protein UT32_C0018G0043 [Parcubacteria group bacterium GW2011_GWC2_39_14]KKR54750.1 MAG: hypothetical protein UT91_C0010G0043 [Parcubacteria group bacterium GW2011_GWA2_40_23]